MSLFGPIGDIAGAVAGGLVDGAKAVLGIHDQPKAVEKKKPEPKPKPQTPTTYDPTPSDSSSSASDYADQLFRDAVGNATRPSPLPGGDTSDAPPVNDPLPGGDTSDAPPRGSSSTATTQPQAASPSRSFEVRVYDSSRATSDGRASYLGDQSTLANAGPNDARWAASNVEQGLQYYAQTFGRNGVDNQGGGVDVVINDHSTDASGNEIFKGNGGFYTTRDANGNMTEAIRWGSGTNYNHRNGGYVDQYSMLYATDLTIHELTHDVIKHETGAIGGTADEAGSVNEGFADVMAASATRDWKLGEQMYANDSTYKYMRNIANPNDPLAVHTLWTSMGQYRQAQANGSVEEHYASGIISNTAYRIQSRIGGEAGWQAVEQLYYHTIDDHRMGDMSFGATASGLRQTAAALWGPGSSYYGVVDEELQRAGL